MNIYKVAELAKVSPATVSKVINGKEGVGEETRASILNIVNEIGYMPKISINKPNNIAVFFRNGSNLFDSEYVRKVLEGISECVFERNYNLLFMPSFKIPKVKDKFAVFCHRQRIVGCIFLDLTMDDYFVSDISGIVPMVVINSVFSGENLYSVCSDDYNGAYKAMEHFFSMGHKKVGIVISEMYFKSHKDRFEAYKDALEQAGIEFDNDLVIDISRFSLDSIKLTLENLKHKNKLPTGLLVYNDQVAVNLISYLKAIGINYPDEISVIGFDDYNFDEYITPPLTTVRQKLYEKGKKAVQIVIDSCTNSEAFDPLKSNYIFDTELIIRRSVVNRL